MLQCFFYGTGQSDEGICVEVHIAGYRILLDCGLRDCSKLLKADPPDLLILSHAHSDHVRSLSPFHRAFPTVPVYSSEVTAQLSNATHDSIQSIPWRSSLELLPNLRVQLFPAGHLPGAAMILLTDTHSSRSQTLLYTGDLSLTNSRLTEGLKLEEIRGLSPDVLIIEGTYGTDRHSHRRQMETQLMERLDRALEAGQSVFMPIPALGLAQEVLILLRSHHLFSGRSVTIWVDEAIATVCEQYEQMIPSFPSSIQNFARYQPLFLDRTIRPWVRRLEPAEIWDEPVEDGPEDSLEVSPARRSFMPFDDARFASSPPEPSPTIVLIQKSDAVDQPWPSWLPSAIQHQNWLIMLPHLEYPNQGRLDRLNDQLKILFGPNGQPSTWEKGGLEAPIETYQLPDHCDGATLPQVIHNLRPQHVVFIHGPEDRLLQLAELEDLNSRYKLHIPASGNRLELPIAEYFVPPTLPDVTYEGEIVETETEILLSLPRDIVADPRWKTLADLGVIVAQWQGNTLVIRAISQRADRKISTDEPI